jgi:hypothetical protein
LRGEGCGVSANEYSCAHRAQINFEDLTPYLTYASDVRSDSQNFIPESVIFFYNIHTVQSSNHIHTIHSPRPFSISSSLVAQWERPPCGAELGIELGPAFQQADALPTDPRRTINPRRTIRSTPHHKIESVLAETDVHHFIYFHTSDICT